MSSSSLTDPAAVASNRMGEITRDQSASLKSKLGNISGWFTLALMAALFAAVAYFAGDTLSNSTPLAIGAFVAIIIAAFIITSALGSIVAGPRMAGLSVEPAPGEVVWENNAYRARSGGMTLETITGGDLQPGNYTFYIVHGTKWVLSAEPASGHPDHTPVSAAELRATLDKPLDLDPSQPPEVLAQRMAELHRAAERFSQIDPSTLSQSDKDAARQSMQKWTRQLGGMVTAPGGLHNLMNLAQSYEQASLPPLDAHGLDELNGALQQVGAANPSALPENQQGRMVGAQRSKIFRGLTSNLTVMGIMLAAAALIAYFLRSKFDWQVALAGGAFVLFVGLFLISQITAELSDWTSGRVLSAEGPVTRYVRTTGSGRNSRPNYYYQQNDLRIKVTHRQYEALLPGRKYRLYYSPRTKTLMNVEPLA